MSMFMVRALTTSVRLLGGRMRMPSCVGTQIVQSSVFQERAGLLRSGSMTAESSLAGTVFRADAWNAGLHRKTQSTFLSAIQVLRVPPRTELTNQGRLSEHTRSIFKPITAL